MVNKEQELTFEKITNLFSLIDEILSILESDSKEVRAEILLERFGLLEAFIKKAVISVEEISSCYTEIIKVKKNNSSRKDLTNNLADLLIGISSYKKAWLIKEND